MQARIRTTAALGSALTRGGLPCFIGTYWPVSEEAGEHFARVFYKLLIVGTRHLDPVPDHGCNIRL